MNRFDTRRQELLMAIDDLCQMTEILAPTDRSIHKRLAQGKKLIEQSTVRLVILGAEGHGKSSLVDAIIGSDIVPREAQQPGTVAPVFVTWHGLDTPKYSIVLNGGSEPVPCSDPDQFRRFILQRFNPDNERGVAYGLVEYKHSLLADGPCLVDMPGLEGVSEAVHASIQENIAAAEAVIIVIRDRQYGATARLLEEFDDRGIAVQAVVSNWSLDFWVTGSDDGLAERIEAQRGIVAEYLSTEDLVIDPRQVFVLHIPSMNACAPAPDAAVTRAPHTAQIERFVDWITRYLDKDRVTRLLNQTVAHLQSATKDLQVRVNGYVHTLDQLLNGNKDIQARLNLRFRKATNHLVKQWPQLTETDEIQELIERNWNMLRGKLRDCHDAVLAAVNEARADLPSEYQWDSDTVTQLARGLRTQSDNAAQEVEQAHTDAILAIMERLRRIADRRIAEFFEIAPVVPGPLDAVHVEGANLVQFDHPAPEPESFMEVFSDRRIIERILASYRAQAQAIDTTRHGAQGQVFDQNVQSTRDTYRSAIRQRLSQKLSVIADLKSNALAESRQLLVCAHEELMRWKLRKGYWN